MVMQLIVLVVFVFVALSILWSTIRTGISPMPSSRTALACLQGLLPETCTGTVLELGSGWGGLALALAQRYPRAQVVGYELSLLPYLYSRLASRRAGCRNLQLERADFFAAAMGEADIVVCYLHHEAMSRLAPLLAEKLAPGALVVSNTFQLPGWTPEATVQLTDMYRNRLYRYRQAESPE